MNYLAIFILLIVAVVISTEPTATNSTQATNGSNNLTTINVNASTLCKKCKCNLEQKLLDCSHLNLNKWFNDDEWNTLKFGDVQFEIIQLDHNSLENVPSFPKISNLKKLTLRHNQIKSIEPRAFKELVQLEILDLYNNRLTSKSLPPETFEGPYAAATYEPLKVYDLDLGKNELHTLHPDIFEHFPKLQKLSLSNNVFQVIDQSTETAISSLYQLKNLDMSYMELQTIPEHIFHAPRDLEILNITGNLLNKIPSALNHAINLKTLILDENPLTNLEGENIFPKLTKLEDLSLSYLKHVKRFGVGAFSGLENLKVFFATNNPNLQEIHPSAFARPAINLTEFDYPPIEKLYLHNNNLSVIDKVLFDRWDKINVLDLRANPWKCDTDNDFLIRDLYPQIFRNTPTLSTKIQCASPEHFKKMEIGVVYAKHLELQPPEHENFHYSSALIGMLVGVIIAIPLALVTLSIYRKGCFGLKRPINYGGALYKRADLQEDF